MGPETIEAGRPLVLRSLRNVENAEDESRSLVRSVSLEFSAFKASFSALRESVSEAFAATSPSS